MTEEKLKGELGELLDPIRESQLELTEVILERIQTAFFKGFDLGKEIGRQEKD